VGVSLDVRAGAPATSGWAQSAQTGVEDALERLQEAGVEWIVYTDVDRDGMLEGPDVERVAQLASRIRGRMIYSGGIGALADLAALAHTRAASLCGVIVGKALYEGRFTVAQALQALAQ
jgi:phosphoribosylformimino-5-aminoimidazole carboxamide ribotide isomerase